MRILFLAPAFPYPPHSGNPLRVYGLIRGLAEANFKNELHLLSFVDEKLTPEESGLHQYCKQIRTVALPHRTTTQRIKTLALSVQPDLAQRLESADMRIHLEKMLAETEFDVIQYEGLEMAIYMRQAQAHQPHAKHFYDAHNAEYALQNHIAQVDRRSLKKVPSAFYSREQTRRLLAFERDICTRADQVIAVSDEDAKALAKIGAKNIAVVPNGIFASDYARSTQPLDLSQNALVFTGKMDYRPNVDAMLWFNNDIFPHILERIPDAKLYIVGQKPHASLSGLSNNPQVELTGWVPSVTPFLYGAKVFVAPLRMGAGTRLKLLEAMAVGCAIVATPTAASGLSADSLAAMRIAETAADFAQSCLSLMASPAERSALANAARTAVSRNYDWNILIPCLMKMYQGAERG